MMSVSRSNVPVTPPPAPRDSQGPHGLQGASQVEAQRPKEPGQDSRTDSRADLKSKFDQQRCTSDFTPFDKSAQQWKQDIAKNDQELDHLVDAYHDLSPEQIEGYGVQDPLQTQIDTEQQQLEDVLQNLVPEFDADSVAA